MTTATAAAPLTRADYGVDAPGVVWRLTLFGAAAVALAGILFQFAWEKPAALGLARALYFGGASCVLSGAAMYFGSKVLKPRLRDRILDSISWRGDERVLDVGCGRGLMLLGAARRVPRGKAVGIDLWQTVDQSGNSQDATLANAQAEGVADRIEIHTGDMRQLPFDPASFDVIVSSFAIHNVPDAAGRQKAIEEIIRVLKPGGRLVIADIQRTADYEKTLRAAGFTDVTRKGPNFLFVIPAYVLSATKAP